MKVYTSLRDPNVVRLLKGGSVGIIRTDTLYGFVARADDEVAVNRVYHVKDRNETKSPIVIIGDISQLFDTPTDAQVELLKTVWPGKVSVILPSAEAPVWIRRDNASVAYRLPDYPDLQAVLQETGPLIAPSANPEAHVPAMSVDEAIDYFGDQVDFYVDGGVVDDDTPSKLLRPAADGTIERLR